MLKRLENNNTAKLLTQLDDSPFINLRVWALIAAYGTDYNFFSVYHDNFTNIVAKLDGSLYICEKTVDPNEIEQFISFCTDINSVYAEKATAQKINKQGREQSDYLLLTYNNGSKKEEDGAVICDCPKLQEIYELICEDGGKDLTVGKFEPFYADMSHRIRHGCAKAYAIHKNGRAVCACLVSAVSNKAGLISGVVTEKSNRNKGYANALIKRAINDLKKAGKTPVVECSEELYPFYQKLGFARECVYSIIKMDL